MVILSGSDSDGITGFGVSTANHSIKEIIIKISKVIEATSHHQAGMNAKVVSILKLISGKPSKAIVRACERVFFLTFNLKDTQTHFFNYSAEDKSKM